MVLWDDQQYSDHQPKGDDKQYANHQPIGNDKKKMLSFLSAPPESTQPADNEEDNMWR